MDESIGHATTDEIAERSDSTRRTFAEAAPSASTS